MTKRPTQPEQDEDAHLSSDLQEAFGQSVRIARLKAGMTQVQLSDRCGIPREEISRIENGLINLTLKQMSRLASVLDGDVAQMLRLVPPTSTKD